MSNAPQSEAEGTQEFLDALLLESAWVHALARRLVRHAEDPEELAQETMLAALERPPSLARPLRAWLAGVAQRILRRQRRSRLHREDREARVASGSEVSQDALVERSLLHEELVVAVRELPESQRTVVLLRYLEGLQPRSIARRLGVPVGTVRSRLSRALDRLRDRFDEGHGGRGAWLPVLAIRTPKGVLFPTLVSAMSIKHFVAIAFAVLLIPLLFRWRPLATDAGRATESGTGGALASLEASTDSGDPGTADPGREDNEREALDPAPKAMARLRMFLRVAGTERPVRADYVLVPRPVDSEGALLRSPVVPIGGRVVDDGPVELEVEAGVPFELQGTPRDSRVLLHGGRLGIAALIPGEVREVVLAFEPMVEREFHLRIVAASTEESIGGASAFVVPGREWGALNGSIDRLPDHPGIRTATSDADGRVRLNYAVGTPAFVLVTAPGYGPAAVALHGGHPTDERSRDVRMTRGFDLELTLEGRVPRAVDSVIRFDVDPRHLFDDPSQTFFRWNPPVKCEGRLSGPSTLTFTDLPSGVELRLARGQYVRGWPLEPSVLVGLPGERRSLTLDLGVGVQVEGVLRSARGGVLEGVRLEWSRATSKRAPITLDPQDCVGHASVTDAEGRFSFDAVPAGSWWLGVSRQAQPPGSDVDWVLPATAIQLHGGEASKSLELTAQPGATIQGLVVGPGGVPASGISGVRARSDVFSGDTWSSPVEGGQFVIGPLPLGDFALEAVGTRSLVGETKWVRAGERDVELHLGPSASLQGAIERLDRGSVQSYSMSLVPVDGGPAVDLGSRGYPESYRARESFDFGGLAPGTYTLWVCTVDGHLAVLEELRLVEGKNELGVLQLDQSARLSLEGTGRLSFDQLRFERNGRALQVRIPTATSKVVRISVPPGPMVVRSTPDAPVEFHRALVLEAGRVTVLRVP